MRLHPSGHSKGELSSLLFFVFVPGSVSEMFRPVGRAGPDAKRTRRSRMAPVLRAARLPLGTYPTPVEHGPSGLSIKRDDLTSDLYGGNKVRKLELLLAA